MRAPRTINEGPTHAKGQCVPVHSQQFRPFDRRVAGALLRQPMDSATEEDHHDKFGVPQHQDRGLPAWKIYIQENPGQLVPSAKSAPSHPAATGDSPCGLFRSEIKTAG